MVDCREAQDKPEEPRNKDAVIERSLGPFFQKKKNPKVEKFKLQYFEVITQGIRNADSRLGI